MSKRKPKSRSYSLRKVGTRELRKSFLIVCEGTKTEPNYFKSFPVPKNVIDIKGLGLDPSKLVENAKKFNQKERYDQVWCVFDRDSWTKNDFNNAIQNAEAEGFGVAYSNEAFELWYILHFEFLNTAIPRNQYLKKLNSLLANSLPGKKYEKNSEIIYEQIFEKQATAIKNAEKLLKQYNPQNPEENNPSTTVHLLVKELNKFVP